MKFSIVIPVFNRPDECDALLHTLTEQTFSDFEVIVVEDGSQMPCEDVVLRYADRLSVRYLSKPNSGPGPSRNFGVDHAGGDYVIILDSDVELPRNYLEAIEASLIKDPCDAFGGPDRAHASFTPIQKAINYGMTSFFTTGGIRGGKTRLDRFFPRSFNMGVRRATYLGLGGFSPMRFGEDVDFSYRLIESGARSRLIPEAWVYHKRRAIFRQFFKQVHNSGIARINLTKRHPGTLKLVHLLPAIFTIGVIACLLLISCGVSLWCMSPEIADALGLNFNVLGMTGFACLFIGGAPLLLYSMIIFIDATTKNDSPRVGALSVVAAFVQLIGYGSGFLRAFWNRQILGRGEFEAFRKNFYK